MATGYWERDGLERAILDALAEAGKNLEALTIEDLAPADHFHGGGKKATDRLARTPALNPGTRVPHGGGGLGGWRSPPPRDAMRAVREGAGSTARTGDDVTREIAGPAGVADIPPYNAQKIIMGDRLDAIVRAQQRNRAEQRIVMIQAVLER